MRRRFKGTGRPLAAVALLMLIAAVVGGYILVNQRLLLPAWVPVIGADRVPYEVELETAQALTPGQGQTVQIAGLDVGDVDDVRLRDGVAVVKFSIKRRDAEVFRDASVLVRPKTQLNDMVLALDPGTREAGRAPEGWTIPLERSRTTVNFDEVLASLDADTRASLQLLLGATGEALDGEGGARTGQVLRRFEPLARHTARLNGALAERRRSIRRAVSTFRQVAEALGDKDDELARAVAASGTVFGAIRRQEASLRDALGELPPTLRATRTGLEATGALAAELGPAAQALRPTARALAPALRDTRPFLRDTTPVLRDQLRPFARDVRPVVADLRPAAQDLAAVAPDLTSSLGVLNDALDTLAFNPEGKEEGHLFWLAWTNAIGPSLFNSADAHGPLRRGLVLTSCSSLNILDQIGQVNKVLGTLSTLLNPPKEACGLSPTPTPAAPAAAAPTTP